MSTRRAYTVEYVVGSDGPVESRYVQVHSSHFGRREARAEARLVRAAGARIVRVVRGGRA